MKQGMAISMPRREFQITKRNPLFSEAKIYVMYHGENRNYSNISKETVDRNLDSIYNIPIIGEFLEAEGEEKSNFGSHGGQIIIDEKGMKFIQTTRPIGVVPESARVYWENVRDEKEITREYLVIEGALVWNRYEEEVATLKEANFGQSMEVEVEDGWFDDSTGIYNITQFLFSALCILGIEGRVNGEVTPAFENAKIITYSLDKEDIKDEWSEMMKDFKLQFSSNMNENGGEDETLEDEKKEIFEEGSQVSETVSEGGEQSADVAIQESEPVVVVEDEPKVAEDEKAEPEAAETEKEGVVEEVVEELEESEKEDFEAKYSELKIEFEALKEKYESAEKELDTLRQFKAGADRFEHEDKAYQLFKKLGLNDEDVKDIDVHEFSIEQLEERCLVIVGRKAISNKEFSEKEDSNKVNLDFSNLHEKNKKSKRYGDLFKKYSVEK